MWDEIIVAGWRGRISCRLSDPLIQDIARVAVSDGCQIRAMIDHPCASRSVETCVRSAAQSSGETSHVVSTSADSGLAHGTGTAQPLMQNRA
ncbi:MAG: hypothetical protein IPH85_12415 [Ignavibacteria bacterium]|nr:hypothetical protein [Ignavibacteria bacterium]